MQLLFWKKKNKRGKSPSPSKDNGPGGPDSVACPGPHRVIIRDASAPGVAPPIRSKSRKPRGVNPCKKPSDPLNEQWY